MTDCTGGKFQSIPPVPESTTTLILDRLVIIIIAIIAIIIMIIVNIVIIAMIVMIIINILIRNSLNDAGQLGRACNMLLLLTGG